jgi:3-oxoacyl-[acyl-carrier protein] reductase
MAAIAPVTADVKQLGRKVIEAKCDLTSEKDVKVMAARTLDTFGRIDILVNVAGGRGPLETAAWDTTPEQMDEILALNVKGAFLAMRAVAPAMQKQRSGKIVNIGGTFGLRGRALRMAYSASKWGVRGVVKAFALELGPYNVNVNNVAPGMVDGPRFRTVCEKMSKRLGISLEEAMRKHAEEYALKRVSTDEDVANAVLFFASDVSKQITGQDIAVDGGWVI